MIQQDGWITGGYNALNQPMLMTSNALSPNWMFFGYDPLGRCVKRWVGSLSPSGNVPSLGSNPAYYFYYEGANLIQEGQQSWNAERTYVHGARVDEVVAQITPANNWIRYFHYDANGNCTLQTDGWGNMVEQYYYDAFGNPSFWDASGNNIGYSPWGNRMLFTGREWIASLKLYDYRARLYNPELGRFMQPDPKEFAAGDYNLYRYCRNDPVNRVDPTGLQDEKPTQLAVEFQKLRSVLGSNIPQWVTTARVGIGNLFNVSKKDHADRTQTVYKNGTLSQITKAVMGTHMGLGGFVRDKNLHEDVPHVGGWANVALVLHIHHDLTNVSTTTPSKGLDTDVARIAPVLFSSESLYKSGQGILITPNGSQEPLQTSVGLR